MCPVIQNSEKYPLDFAFGITNYTMWFSEWLIDFCLFKSTLLCCAVDSIVSAILYAMINYQFGSLLTPEARRLMKLQVY